jgi:hypothetical protein
MRTPAQQGVVVTLTYGGDDGILGTADDSTQTATTDINGRYSFTNLSIGEYEITLPPVAAGLSGNWVSSPDGVHVFLDSLPGWTWNEPLTTRVSLPSVSDLSRDFHQVNALVRVEGIS